MQKRRSGAAWQGSRPSWFHFTAVNHHPGPKNRTDRKSTRLNSSHLGTSYAVFCLKKKKVLWSLRATAPGNSHCTPTPTVTSGCPLFFLGERAPRVSTPFPSPGLFG